MTRLTPDMIRQVPVSLAVRDDQLRRVLGTDLKGLGCHSVGMKDEHIDLKGLRAAVVPVTSGKGVTPGFCPSVCAIIEHLGMSGFVTGETDVAGLGEAIGDGADIVFMADDNEFLAINLRKGKVADNTRATARGYFTAMNICAGGVEGKEVLVIGAGRVGSCIIEMLVGDGAVVKVVEPDTGKSSLIRSRFPQVEVISDLETAVRNSIRFINASPARIPGEWIREGAIVSSPGMPYSFDVEGERKMKALVHDPLQIGVTVMAIWAASFSCSEAAASAKWLQAIEVMQ